jgi:hypothetical protein
MTKFLKVILVMGFFILGFSVISFSQQENIIVTTYYPSPFGVYNELRLFPHSPGSACTPATAGTMYIDSTDGLLYICNGNTATWVNEASSILWTLNGTNLYPTNNTWNVGIGKVPSAGLKLDLDGSMSVPNNMGYLFGGCSICETGMFGSLQIPRHIDFRANGVTKMTITGTGVGIGTTTPNSPLVVNGTAVITEERDNSFPGLQIFFRPSAGIIAAPSGGIRAVDATNHLAELMLLGSTVWIGDIVTGTYMAFRSGSLYIPGWGTMAYTAPGNSIVFDERDYFNYDRANNVYGWVINNIERMRINGNGNVGIGTSSPDPYRLKIDTGMFKARRNIYDSGWFSIRANSEYTKTHNLGTTAVHVEILLSKDSGGSDAWAAEFSNHLDFDNVIFPPHFVSFCDLTSTSIKIFTAAAGWKIPDVVLGKQTFRNLNVLLGETGYCRVLIWALKLDPPGDTETDPF